MAYKRLLSLVVLLCASAAVAQFGDSKTQVLVPDLARGVQSDPASLIFDNKRTTVNPGESLSLDCGVSGDYRYCHWDNGRDTTIQVEDVYGGYIDGLSKPEVTKGNECGIVINSVTIEDHGLWTCKVYVIGHSLQETKNVTVTIRPTSPVLEVTNRPLVLNEGDQEIISCSVAAARPRVSIKWYLGDEDITYSSHVENSLTDNMGTYKSISTLSHMFMAWHNNKMLRCEVEHYTLQTPIDDYVDILVRYKPWGKDVRLYGIRMGDDVEAKVNFSSNPAPLSIKWGYGPTFEEIEAVLPVPGEEGRYSTEMVTLDDGHYGVILRVLEFDEMDAQMSFKVSVGNDLGLRDFRVTISNEKPPNDDIDDGHKIIASTELYQSEEPLSSGTLAVIVIVVLLVILFLLCAVYMRYNHLYCFAEKKAAAQDQEATGGGTSDTESAQSPGFVDRNKKNASSLFGKLQNGFKKNKQQEAKPEDPDKPEDVNPPADKPVDEVVYAELDLAPGDQKPLSTAGEKNSPEEGTEYAQIVGVLSNQEQEKKE